MPASDIDALIEEGLTRYGRGDLDGALLVWEQALTVDPDNEQANSYVDYVRQNYELFNGSDALGDEGASPFGIEDDEYSVEIIESGQVLAQAAAPSAHVDPLDEGWFMEDERVGFVAEDSGSMSSAAVPAPAASVVEIEADEPPRFGTYARARDRGTHEAAATPRVDAELTVEGARALPDDDAPEIEVSAQELEPATEPVQMAVAAEVVSGEFPFPSGGHTPGFGEPQDTTPVGFAAQVTDVRERDLGFVKAFARTPDTVATVETPTVPAPPSESDEPSIEVSASAPEAPEIVAVASAPEAPEIAAVASAPEAPEIAAVASAPAPPAAAAPAPVPAPVPAPAPAPARPAPALLRGPVSPISSVAGAIEAVANALEAMANAPELHEPTVQVLLGPVNAASDFSGGTTADGTTRALADHDPDPDDEPAPPPPPVAPPLVVTREPSKRATTITYEERRLHRASAPPELKITLRTPTRDKIEDAIAAADVMSDSAIRLPPANAFGNEPTTSVPQPPANAFGAEPTASVPRPPAHAFGHEPTVSTPPPSSAAKTNPFGHELTVSTPPPSPTPSSAAKTIPFGPRPTISPASPSSTSKATTFGHESSGAEHTAFGPRPSPTDPTAPDLPMVPRNAVAPADLDDVIPPPPPSALTREMPFGSQPLTGEDRTRTRDLSFDHAGDLATPQRWPLTAAGSAGSGAPTRDIDERPTRHDIAPSRLDARAAAAVVIHTGEGTRADIVLPFDPIDARSAQILDDVDEGASPSEPKEDRTRRRITALIERAAEWQRLGETDKAVTAIDLALAEDPNSALAQKLLHRNRDTIMTVFQTFVGDLQRAPILARPLHELASAPISPRAAFLLSRVDGTMSIEEILDVSGMPRLEAYRYLCQLLLRGILR